MRTSKYFLFAFLLIGMVFLFLPEAGAQCPMCKMGAQSNLENGGTAGAGLNNGILYMLALPYLIVGTIGFVWWRNRRKKEESEDTLV